MDAGPLGVCMHVGDAHSTVKTNAWSFLVSHHETCLLLYSHMAFQSFKFKTVLHVSNWWFFCTLKLPFAVMLVCFWYTSPHLLPMYVYIQSTRQRYSIDALGHSWTRRVWCHHQSLLQRYIKTWQWKNDFAMRAPQEGNTPTHFPL